MNPLVIYIRRIVIIAVAAVSSIRARAWRWYKPAVDPHDLRSLPSISV